MVSGITNALAGTWAMARGDRDWAERLPMSASDVFASFWAVPLSLPSIVLMTEAARRLVLQTPEAAEAAETLQGPVGEAVTAVIGTFVTWAVCLALLAQLARRADAGWRITPLLIGYNWSRLIVNLAAGAGTAFCVAIAALPLVPLFLLLSIGLMVWLEIGILRRSLDIAVGQAIGAMLLLWLARIMTSAGVGVVAGLFAGT